MAVVEEVLEVGTGETSFVTAALVSEEGFKSVGTGEPDAETAVAGAGAAGEGTRTASALCGAARILGGSFTDGGLDGDAVVGGIVAVVVGSFGL